MKKMKFKYIIYIMPVFLISVLALTGCKKSFLDRQPLDRISSAAVFTDKALTEAYLLNAYSNLPTGFTMYQVYGEYGIYMLANISDEARSKSTWIPSETTIVPGFIKPTDNPLDTWEGNYKAIRIANNIIVNLKTAPFEKAYVDRISSEARFIRAVLYFYLARSYGAVPLIKEPQSIEDTKGMLVARTPQQEVYAFIDKELEEVSQLLPSAANLSQSEY